MNPVAGRPVCHTLRALALAAPVAVVNGSNGAVSCVVHSRFCFCAVCCVGGVVGRCRVLLSCTKRTRALRAGGWFSRGIYRPGATPALARPATATLLPSLVGAASLI
jgi:hypothetical protein